jgi:hypothetical protein
MNELTIIAILLIIEFGYKIAWDIYNYRQMKLERIKLDQMQQISNLKSALLIKRLGSE